MKGERIPDGEFPYKPGQYSKHRKSYGEHEDEIQDIWLMTSPNGIGIFWIAAKPLGCGHEIDEHEDGTISVVPKPGNSNSILVHKGRDGESWHGYIRRGVWEEV